MSTNKFGANRYKQTSVLTASRGQVLIMLYEAAIRYTRQAIGAIEKKDTKVKGMAIGKVHDIVNELINSLDFKVGGDVAKDLERLYNFITEKLLQANLTDSTEDLKAIENVLVTLHSGWKEAVAQVEGGKKPE